MQDQQDTYGHEFSAEFTSKYEVTGVLGEGGMGQVLRGKQKGLGRDVAIKLLTNRSYATPERRQRFKDEAQRCAAMSHPNLVGVYDYGEEGDRPYMVMELVDGESVADRIKRDGTIPIREALKIGIDICEGLSYAHELGLVHRDIKSDNILLDRHEKAVKVADFGIATESKEGDEEKENVIIGTPSYMSPEQASGKRADARSDIYSTGVILYEMLTGKVPFTGETSMAIIIKHLNEQAASMTELCPECPPQLEEIILRTLEKDPNRRYQSASDLASQLKKATSLLESWQNLAKEAASSGRATTTSSIAVPISSIMPETEEEKRQKRILYSLAAVAGLAVLAVVVYFLFLAPPTYQAMEKAARAGFTQAEVSYRTSHPVPTVVQYREVPDGAIEEVTGEGGPTTSHQLLLEGLEEATAYSWKPIFPHDQEGDWKDLETRTLSFGDVRMSPRVSGAHIQWRTSLPVEMEVEYLQGGKVKEIIKLEGIHTEHTLKASFPDPSVPYQIRLKAVLEGRFTKSELLEEVPTIDLGEIDRLNKAVSTALASDDPAFYSANVFQAIQDQKIPERLERFQRIRDLFFQDEQVTPEVRMALVRHLDLLRELDLFVAWAGPALRVGDFRTGAAAAYGPGFQSSREKPFRDGRAVEVLSTSKDMVFDFDPPPPPISGARPPDAKDTAKFAFEGEALKNAQDAYFEIDVEDVPPHCYFQVEFGHGKKPDAVLSFLPAREDAAGGRPYRGTFRARFDPRLIHPRKEVLGWVKLRFLRGTVGTADELRGVRGGFRGLRLVYRR